MELAALPWPDPAGTLGAGTTEPQAAVAAPGAVKPAKKTATKAVAKSKKTAVKRPPV